MIIGYRPKPLTLAELMAIVNPEQARQPEVVPAILYSERTYVSAATVNLTFFDTNQADPTLDNVSNGQLPAPQFFQEHQLFITPLVAPDSAIPPAGAINDVFLLLAAGRGLAIHTISNKEYLRLRMISAGASGGATGGVAATLTAPLGFDFANSSTVGLSPFHENGMVVIPPQTNFTFSLQWQAAQTLAGGNAQILVEIYGALYRRVL